jgi:hypothetical protein
MALQKSFKKIVRMLFQGCSKKCLCPRCWRIPENVTDPQRVDEKFSLKKGEMEGGSQWDIPHKLPNLMEGGAPIWPLF